MTREEVRKRISKNGVPLENPDTFIWREKERILSIDENGIVINFSGVNNCKIFASRNSTIITGDDCEIDTGSECNIITGDDCKIKTSSLCSFNAGNNCSFSTSDYCNFVSGRMCNFKTGSFCVFDSGSACTFTTKDNCTFKTKDDCIFESGDHCVFRVNENCVFKTGEYCVISFMLTAYAKASKKTELMLRGSNKKRRFNLSNYKEDDFLSLSLNEIKKMEEKHVKKILNN